MPHLTEMQFDEFAKRWQRLHGNRLEIDAAELSKRLAKYPDLVVHTSPEPDYYE